MTAETPETKTDIALLPPSERAALVLASTKTEQHLLELVAETATITEVVDAAGREQAHRAGMKLRTARTTIEKTGKAARDDANAFSRAVIAEEKRLQALMADEEDRVLGLRNAFDERIKAEQAAIEAAEAARVAGLRKTIDAIRGLPLALAGESASVIADEIEALGSFAPGEDFAELAGECSAVAIEALQALHSLHARVVAQEAAAALVAAERAQMVAERKAMEAERAAWLAEKAAFEASKALALPVTMEADPVGDEIQPMSDAEIKAVRAVSADAADDYIDQPIEDEPAAISVSDWRIRKMALATAHQFIAMAGKAELCGAQSFAAQLLAAAYSVREGDFDAALAGADSVALVGFDNAMIDASVACIEAAGTNLAEAA